MDKKGLSDKSKVFVLKKLEKVPDPNIDKFSKFLNDNRTNINDDNISEFVDNFFENYKKEIIEYIDENQIDNEDENKAFIENVGNVVKQKTSSLGLVSKLLVLIGTISAGYYGYMSHPQQSYQPQIQKNISLFSSVPISQSLNLNKPFINQFEYIVDENPYESNSFITDTKYVIDSKYNKDPKDVYKDIYEKVRDYKEIESYLEKFPETEITTQNLEELKDIITNSDYKINKDILNDNAIIILELKKIIKDLNKTINREDETPEFQILNNILSNFETSNLSYNDALYYSGILKNIYSKTNKDIVEDQRSENLLYRWIDDSREIDTERTTVYNKKIYTRF